MTDDAEYDDYIHSKMEQEKQFPGPITDEWWSEVIPFESSTKYILDWLEREYELVCRLARTCEDEMRSNDAETYWQVSAEIQGVIDYIKKPIEF